MQRAVIYIILVILIFPLTFANGMQFLASFSNGDQIAREVKIHWYAQADSSLPEEITSKCSENALGQYSFSIEPKAIKNEVRTITCTIEDIDFASTLAGKRIYPVVEYKKSDDTWVPVRLGNVKAVFSKSFFDDISDKAKETVKNTQDGLASLLGKISCDKTAGLCEKKGDYFCFLTDSNFKGLSIDQVSSVMDIASNRDALANKLGNAVGEDASSRAMAGCLPKGTTSDIFSALLIKDTGAATTDKTLVSLNTANLMEEVRVLVKNTESVTLTGDLEWYIKPKGEADFVLAKRCSQRVDSGGVRSDASGQITLTPGENAVFTCGSFGFNGIKPSTGPHEVKVYFSGTASDGRKIFSEIKQTQFKIKTIPGDSPALSCKDTYGGVCKNWYEGCAISTELTKLGLFSDCKELKHCCVPMPETLSKEDLASIDLVLDTFRYGEICNNGLDDDYDGLIDCQDPDCWGRLGPDVNGDGKPDTCCDELSDCKSANEPCTIEYCDSKNGISEAFGSNVPVNIFKLSSSGQIEEKYLQICVSAHRAACDPTECDYSKVCAPNTALNPGNTKLKICQSPDDSKAVCEQCIGCHWDPIATKCCGDDRHPDLWGNIHPEKDLWCNMNDGACVYGYWFDDHCKDLIKDCDETNIDCGGSYCKPCSGDNFIVDERGSIKVSVYKDKNGNGVKDSGESLFGTDGLSVKVTGAADYSETKSVDSSGIISFENLKVGTYVVDFSSAYSNWKVTSDKSAITDVKANSASEVLFGVQGVPLDLVCTPPIIVRGVLGTYTCTIRYAKTSEPVSNAKYGITLDEVTYSGVSDTDGIAKFIYDPKAKGSSDSKTGMVISQADLASEKQTIAVFTATGNGDSSGSFTFQIEDPSQSSDGSDPANSGQSESYWIVTGCSNKCADKGPCAWYADLGKGFNGLIKAEDLCKQYFVGDICDGVNLIDPNHNRLNTNPFTEIDDDGCGIYFSYMGQDSSVTGITCSCPTKANAPRICTDKDSDADTKGYNIFKQSETIVEESGTVVEKKEDACVDNSQLKEYVCSSDGSYIYELTYDCQQTIDARGTKQNYACRSGACVKDCTKCGWFNFGVCGQNECESLGTHCKWTTNLGVGTCGFA